MAKEDKILIGLYNDFYGVLLTKKQSEMVDMYYNKDMSLSEIAKIYDVTRQAIRDTLQKAENTLLNLEDKLKLFSKTMRIKDYISSLDEKKYKDVIDKINKILEE